jgi:hypothetical protein
MSDVAITLNPLPASDDFSSANFIRFQDLLRKEVEEASLLWLLRDGLFAAIFNDTRQIRRVARSKDGLLLIPGGWILWLLLRVLHGHWKRSGKTLNQRKPATAHFLFISPRSNHFKRIHPLMNEMAATMSCRGWIAGQQILPLLQNRDAAAFSFICEYWTAWVKPADLWTAARESRHLKKLLGPRMKRLQHATSCIHIVSFLAWLRFWRHEFRASTPELLVITYEKAPVAKAMFEAGREAGVPRRIHWAHSLRHGSLQATLATELWCMTELDVDYFRPLLPSGCQALYRENPESAELIRTIGMLDENSFADTTPRRFLFLGSGKDVAYTREQSEADMGVIRNALDAFGDKVEWRFRPHPGNVDGFRADLQAVGLGDVELSQRPLNEDLAWAQGVGSTFSSVLVDVKPTGRKIFWVHDDIRTLYGVDELIRGGFGVHLDSSQVIQRLSEALAIKQD